MGFLDNLFELSFVVVCAAAAVACVVALRCTSRPGLRPFLNSRFDRFDRFEANEKGYALETEQDGLDRFGDTNKAPTKWMARGSLPDRGPIVQLAQGTYEGKVQTFDADTNGATTLHPNPIEVFLGIPFAEPTGGENRFRPPVPMETDPRGIGTDEPIAATELGQHCPGTFPDMFVPEGEDCLNVNVYRPARDDGNAVQDMPVLVYVHGGAFNNGMGVERDMDSFVAYAESPVVGVSFNYRVGALGFLGQVGDAREPLNIGLRDARAALDWVQQNIACFGGDAGNVTVAGLSAGAHAVGHLVLAQPRGSPAPFRRAVLESGSALARAVWDKNHPRPVAQLHAFLAATGAFADLDLDLNLDAPLDAPLVMGRLRALPLETVLEASRSVWNEHAQSVCWPFQPVVDGDLIKDTPLRAWRARTSTPDTTPDVAPEIPLLTGFNTNEGTMFVPNDEQGAGCDTHVHAFFQSLVPGLNDDDWAAFSRVYPDPATDDTPNSRYRMPPGTAPPGVSGTQWRRLEAAYAHYAYICPVLQTAHFSPTTTYVYEFAARNGPWDTANHGDNAAAVTHSMDILEGCPGLLAVADAMNTAWVRFATCGNPNGDEQQQQQQQQQKWPAFGDSAHVMVFGAGNDECVPPADRKDGPAAKPGTPMTLRTLTPHEHAQCRFWWDRVALSEGSGVRESVRAGAKSKVY